MFDKHLTVLPDWRARESAGRRMPIRTARMPITTSNSTSVKARWTGAGAAGRGREKRVMGSPVARRPRSLGPRQRVTGRGGDDARVRVNRIQVYEARGAHRMPRCALWGFENQAIGGARPW